MVVFLETVRWSAGALMFAVALGAVAGDGATAASGASDASDAITTTAPSYTQLKVLGGRLGQYPYAGLVQAPDGWFYGTTSLGGAQGDGTVYRWKADTGRSQVVHAFGPDRSGGVAPAHGVTLGRDGAIYGVTRYGGVYEKGTVFRIDARGRYAVLHSFGAESQDGAFPSAALVLTPDGSLFGATGEGGLQGDGTVFSVDAAGAVRTRLHLDAKTIGSRPVGLTADSDGVLLGVAGGGGPVDAGWGTVFSFDPSRDAATLVHAFNPYGPASKDGHTPTAPLVRVSKGVFYGTTYYANTFGGGTLFRVARDGRFATLTNFPSPPAFQGSASGAMALGRDGYLYGASANVANDYGDTMLFRVNVRAPIAIEVLHVFSWWDGDFDGVNPRGALLQSQDAYIYGTTLYGGQPSFGTVFRYGPIPAR